MGAADDLDSVTDSEYAALLEENAEELYENAPAGYLSSLPDGSIVKVNAAFLAWTGYRAEDVVRVLRLHDLLPSGARIYYETHYAPLLQLQGSVSGIAVEIVCAGGRRLPVLLNSTLVRDEAGTPRMVRTTGRDRSRPPPLDRRARSGTRPQMRAPHGATCSGRTRYGPELSALGASEHAPPSRGPPSAASRQIWTQTP